MTIVQFPNKALGVALTAAFINLFATGWLNQLVTIIFYIAMLIWAYLEITSGVNWFRKSLGWVALVYIVVIQVLRH